MSSNVPARRSRRHVARLEQDVTRALELAEARSMVIAGRQAARLRAAGRVARVSLDEQALVNQAEALHGYGTDEHARMRLRLLADGAALTLRSITQEMSWR